MKAEVVSLIRDGLKTAFATEPVFKAYYLGDPDVIPEFNLPAIVVSKLSDETTELTVADDDVVERVLVKVILNKKDDWNEVTDEVDLAEQKLRRLVEARDDQGRYLPNTVKRVLREVLDDNDLIIVGPLTFEVGTLPRPNELVTMEGHLTATVRYTVPIQF